ncbi:MAG: acyltransferase [Alphaproteobacteria bacterium]|nr:acyltransferase [Alphaproteobacteria bacterium]
MIWRQFPMKLYSVQYLRGLAAALVVVAHAADHPLAQTSPLLAALGELGVTLFFVISGFIMVAITGEGPFRPGNFLARRAIRVVPMYWLFTTLAALLLLLAPSLFKSTVFTWPHYAESLLFVPHQSPSDGGYSPLLSLGWTLNYEVFFYFAFAALAALSSRWRVGLLAIAFTALSVAGQMVHSDNVLWSFYANLSLLAFSSGAVIGQLFISGHLHAAPRALAGLLLMLGAGLLVAGFMTDGTTAFIAMLGASVCALVGTMVLEARLGKHALLEKLGDASYSTYLVHMFVVGAVVVIGKRLLPIGGSAAYYPIVAAAIFGAIVTGLVVHRLIEKPLLRVFGTGKSATLPTASVKPAPI